MVWEKAGPALKPKSEFFAGALPAARSTAAGADHHDAGAGIAGHDRVEAGAAQLAAVAGFMAALVPLADYFPLRGMIGGVRATWWLTVWCQRLHVIPRCYPPPRPLHAPQIGR